MESGLAARHPEITTYAGRAVGDPTATIRLDLTPMGFHAFVRGDGRRPPGTSTRPATATTPLPLLPPRRPAGSDRGLVEPELDEGTVKRLGTSLAEAPGAEVRLRTYPAGAGHRPVLRRLLRHRQRARGEGHADQPRQPDLQRRPRDPDGPDQRHRQAQPRHRRGGDRAQRPVRRGRLLHAGPARPAARRRCSTATGSCSARSSAPATTTSGTSRSASTAAASPASASSAATARRTAAPACPTPVGDFFAVDYVAHEMGHQFGGNHTFNGTAAQLLGRQPQRRHARSSRAAARSIMAYAGICQQDNLQPHSDPYFSQRSFDRDQRPPSPPPARRSTRSRPSSLRDFDTDGDSFTLSFNGAQTAPIVRGTNYTAPASRPRSRPSRASAPSTSATSAARAPRSSTTPASRCASPVRRTPAPTSRALGLTPASGDVTGFVGETAQGGPQRNGGSTVTPTGNHAPWSTAPATTTIPIRTPFALTGQATDADGDPLVLHLGAERPRRRRRHRARQPDQARRPAVPDFGGTRP